MDLHLTRRTFLAGTAAAAAVSTLPVWATAGGGIKFGYAAITWGDHERESLDDIAAVGFPGVQLRANAVRDFQAAELKDLLARHKLTFVALSSGDISLDKPAEEQLALHVKNAHFLKDAGGLYLQILDQLKPSPRTVTADDCVRVGKLLTELGKRTADIGVPLGYHNHLGSVSEKPENLAIVLENADPKYVKLELDVAHSTAGGGDPVKQIIQYKDRLLFLHLKDVVERTPATPGRYPFQFVELGRGKVDLPGVFASLRKIHYSGWAVVELDGVPDKSRTPKDCAQINYDYLRKAGYKI